MTTPCPFCGEPVKNAKSMNHGHVCAGVEPIQLSTRDTELFDEIMTQDFEPNEALKRAGAAYARAVAEGRIKIRD